MPEEFFAHTLDKFNDRDCLIVPGQRTLTYREVIALADAAAVPLGTHKQLIFVEGKNEVGAIIAYLGCLRAGHAVHIIDGDSDNTSLIATYNPHAVIRSTGDGSTIERRHDEPLALHESIAVLLSTSGSTGTKKLVKLSRTNIDSNARSIVEYLEMIPDDRSLTTLPPQFSLGMSVIHAHLTVGGAIVMNNYSVQQPEFMKLLEDYKITNFAGVPYTYQLLDSIGADFSKVKSLRFMQQAGGRTAPELVRRLVRAGNKQGWKFYVMYGQTEASPRISYVPPAMVMDHADTIGTPVPGGKLYIKQPDGTLTEEPNIEGELVYTGPNVMVGYALSVADLAHAETIPYLFTGDIGMRDPTGLFRITGRQSRFVKPFGLRISLDEIEIFLESQGPHIPVIGDNEEIILCFDKTNERPGLPEQLGEKYGLPHTMFHIFTVPEIPHMATSKVDYQSLRKQYAARLPAAPGALSQLADFIKGSWLETVSIVLGRKGDWSSVEDIFQVHFPTKTITSNDSFVTLGGDSLLHIQLSLALEDYLGRVPQGWHTLAIKDLEQSNG